MIQRWGCAILVCWATRRGGQALGSKGVGINDRGSETTFVWELSNESESIGHWTVCSHPQLGTEHFLGEVHSSLRPRDWNGRRRFPSGGALGRRQDLELGRSGGESIEETHRDPVSAGRLAQPLWKQQSERCVKDAVQGGAMEQCRVVEHQERSTNEALRPASR